MIDQLMLAGVMLALLGGALVAVLLVYRQKPNPYVRNILLTLVGIEIILAMLYALSWAEPGVVGFWDWMVDLDEEQNIGTIFAAVQLALTGLTAFFIGWRGHGITDWKRYYWWLLAALLIFLGADEYFTIHENLLLHSTLPFKWRELYVAVGILIVGISALAFWRGFRRDFTLFALLFIGLAMIGTSGIAVEYLIWKVLCGSAPGQCWHPLLVIEETFEMVASTVILAGFLLYAQAHLPVSVWRQGKRFVAITSVAWTLWLLLWFWPLPEVEYRLTAAPVDIQYLDGDLELIGYRLSADQLAPDQTINVTVYWRAHQPLPQNYNISLRILARPEGELMAQQDLPEVGTYPSRAWLPGHVVKMNVSARLPDDLPTPASYWAAIRIWYGDETFSTGEPITATNQRLLTDEVVILTSIPAPNREAPAAPPMETDFRFGNIITLYGYAMPDSAQPSETLTLRFWWQSDAPTSTDLTQFVHLRHQTSGEIFVFDAPPFAGAFPTTDWLTGQRMMNTRSIALPPDMPPGQYDVFTGLYDAGTLARNSVIDNSGQPVPDSAVHLGIVMVE